MYNKLLFLILTIALFSCKLNNTNSETLLTADRAFSALSKEKGLNVAFIEYAHDSAVLLRDNSYPIIGKKAVSEKFISSDTSYRLTWEPDYAYLSKSNDIGYTYGIYTFTTSDTIQYGTYVTIWRNTQMGWKYVLDSGNDGLQK